MSGVIPSKVRQQLKETLWRRADALNWSRISDSHRSQWYQNWSKDSQIGGVLAHFMDPRKVRVYIKDSLLKSYMREKSAFGLTSVAESLGVDGTNLPSVKRFAKPDGALLADGRLFCWGNSRDWKFVILATFERAYKTPMSHAHAVVFFETGQTLEAGTRQLVAAVAEHLRIERVVWIG
jgi:hypothetical protein